MPSSRTRGFGVPGPAGVGAAVSWPRRSRAACGPWSRRAAATASRSHTISPTTVRRGPRASTVPRTRSSPEWKMVCAHRSWESSKNARSTRPEPSSRVTKMTLLPDGMGGVWVEARTPATRTRCPGCRRCRWAASVAPSSRSSRWWCSIRCWDTSMDRTSSSALIRSRLDISRRPLGSGLTRVSPSTSCPSAVVRLRVCRCSSVAWSSRSRRVSGPFTASRAPIWMRRSAIGSEGRARCQKSCSPV